MEKYLGFIDLLGFSKMVETNFEKATMVLDDFYNLSYNIIHEDRQVKGNLFSDSLICHSESFDALVDCLGELYRECLKQNREYLNNRETAFFLLPRGAISKGYLNIENRAERPNLKKEFIVSPALVHSAHLEKSIKGSRLFVASKNSESLGFINNSKYVFYENPSFKLWRDFSYHDLLWYSDRKKERHQQKREIVELIMISIELLKANANNTVVLDQYINTLRIGLLSYSNYLNTLSDAILKTIISDFKDDKYWLLWITAFEMIAYSGDLFRYTALKEVVEFYKEVSLKESWRKVIKEINKPNERYLRGIFEAFLSSLYITTIDS